MDDYRDLVTVSLALLCAGVMLVAGQLYIEHRATDAAPKTIETPVQPGPPPMVSHTPRQKVSQSVDLAEKRPA
ncbi:hypothetical protein JJB99_20350 [Bradyrhizobium diazoefficiens]|uniref:hypothetical protein n=1 Tax=Bradyrhizobium diazoefficiens TaxID=1355477 RepID=UPI00190CEFC3|nr:hypothetical protein [Bradyrhizobium diazoefficiens]QQO18391.1 hypothetical protein JJB99_20350 [Bradyrhizobium diazoefficiens]